jgi:alkylation response protein AidB-like acyl-CoA dehydrogenase
MGVVDLSPGRWVSQYMFSLAFTIAGGTSNVQRNIIGERVLGLPRDPRPA